MIRVMTGAAGNWASLTTQIGNCQPITCVMGILANHIVPGVSGAGTVKACVQQFKIIKLLLLEDG
jgi:hypothetical protein